MLSFDKNRVNNFSDAVFSIAATLLVLDLAIPTSRAISEVGFEGLLYNRIPSFIGFVVSFFVIFLFWKAHLRNFSHAKSVNNRLLTSNIFTLLFIVLLPFTTGFYVAGFNDASSFRLYCANIIALGVCDIYSIMNIYTLPSKESTMSLSQLKYYALLAMNVVFIWSLSAALADQYPYISRGLFVLIFFFDYFINLYWGRRIRG